MAVELTWRQALAWRMRRHGLVERAVELSPFGKLPAWAAKQVAGEAERLADYLGGALTLRGTS